MNHNATDDHDATARPERAIDTVETGRQCPLGTPWCTNHNSEYGENQCVSESFDAWDPRPGERVLRDRQVSVWLTQEPGMEEPVVAVDTAPGAEITLGAAQTLMEGMTALLAAVER